MSKPPGVFCVAAAAIILNDKNQMLVTQRSFDRDHHPGKWEFLSGRVDQGETIEEALQREAMEELSIDIEIIRPIATFHFYRGSKKVEHQGVSFLCKHRSGEVKVDGIEEIDYKWIDLNEALELIEGDQMKRDIRIVMKLKEDNLIY